jgi:hypothetical protein
MRFQLKITLQDILPPIWRRVLVSDKSTLLDLHDLIQYCFDWMDYHLHMFEVDAMKFVRVEDWEEDGDLYQDDSMAHLGDLIPKYIPEGRQFNYLYDFGDGWEIKILVEKILDDQEGGQLSRVLAGKRAAPPEDVGSVGGYAYFLEAIQDPQHPEHWSYLTWIDGYFNPEDFNIDEANQALAQTLRRRTLIRESTWPVGPLYGNFRGMTKNKWTESLPKELKVAAADLPLRRDMVTLLTYLAKNKVKGTKARGNFPRKHIRAITADFVDPPPLDTVIGDSVWKLQSEDEVQELMRYHLLACIAGLVFGGENLPWELLPQGEVFLSLPAEGQVWYLAHVWFREFNWFYEYEDEGDFETSILKIQIITLFTSYPVGKDIPIAQVSRDFAAMQGISYTKAELNPLKYFLQRTVIQPLGTFGIIESRESNPEDFFFSEITAIRVNELGHQILKEQNDYFKPRH